MKNKCNSFILAAAGASLLWMLPMQSMAAVQVDGLFYELDAEAQTAVVVANPDKYAGNVEIPASIESDGVSYTVAAISDCAFIDCDQLTSLTTVGDGLTYIGYSAFERCHLLRSINIADGLEKINWEAFKDCSNLSLVSLPASLYHLGDRSFLGCTSLTWFRIPEGVQYLGKRCLEGCSSLSYVVADRVSPLTVKAISFSGIDQANTTLLVPVGSRSKYAKANVWKEFASIDETLEVGPCGDQTLYIVYPEMTMRIGGLGKTWNYLSDEALCSLAPDYYAAITALYFDEGVTGIESATFCEWPALTSATFPGSLVQINDLAFSNCAALSDITFNDALYNVGYRVFEGTAWFDAQPDGVVYAGPVAYALKNVPDASDVVLTDGTLGISVNCFPACNLNSLYVPASVLFMRSFFIENPAEAPYRLVSNFGNISKISVDPANEVYDSRQDCNAIIETSTNTLVGSAADVELPEGVAVIGSFSLWNQPTVTIPASVTFIQHNAFVRVVDLGAEEPAQRPFPLESIKVVNATPCQAFFEGVDRETCILYVPMGSKEAYQTADEWKEFKNIVEYDPEQGLSSVEQLRAADASARQRYDLQGRPVKGDTRSTIVIENGKKRIQR